MNLRELLVERYAVLHNLKPKSVILFGNSLDRFRDFLGREPELSDLEDLTVSRFLRWRAVTPHRGLVCAPATVRKDMAHLVSLWNHACKKRIEVNGKQLEFPDLPRNIVRVPQKPPKGFTVAEVSALIRHAAGRRGNVGPVPANWMFQTMIFAAWLTGERLGGLLGLRWDNVDLEGCLITFLGGTRKGGIQTITRAITPQLAEMMRKHRRAANELVWPWNEHRAPNAIFCSMKLLCYRADVTPRGFHAIRKASCSYVKRGGGDATEHAAHSNQKTTKDHYLDPSITGQQSAIDFLPPLDLGDEDKPAA